MTKVYATDIDGLNEWWSARCAQKERTMSKAKKMDQAHADEQARMAKRREADALRKREKRAALKGAIGIVASEIAKPPSERVKLIDEPVPYRASVVSLAKNFSDACVQLAEEERRFDAAVAGRAKAKLELDAEIARLANEVGS